MAKVLTCCMDLVVSVRVILEFLIMLRGFLFMLWKMLRTDKTLFWSVH
jgi:hypothetical protein